MAGAYFTVINIPFLKIRSLEISGQEKLTKQVIINDLTGSLLNSFWLKFVGLDNLLFWPQGTVVLANPLVDRASISKNWGEGKVLLNIKERERYGMWCSLKCYWFDKEGIIFDRAPETEEKSILKINASDNDETPLQLGDVVLRQDLFDNLKKILEFLKESFAIQTHRWNENNLDLKSFTAGGAQLLFNARFDPDINLKALKELSLKPFFKKLNYVDLRVENRIYYK